MALSPEEQAELNSLSSTAPQAKANASGGLSDSEADELKALQSNSTITPEMHAKFQKGQDQSDAIIKGITSGASLGGQNMIGGAVQAGLDVGQKGLNKLGLAGPSPTQVNAKLAAQGTTGDVGPTNDKDLYYQGKHETEADFDKTQAKNPLLFGASQVAGGLALPVGAAAKGAQGATAAVRILGAAKAGIPVGAAVGGTAGFLGGKNDLAGPNANPMGVAKDTAIGAGIGAGVGALGGAGVQAASELPIANTLKNIANNRAGAAANVNSIVNQAKGIGQSLLDNNALPTFGGVEGIKAGVQQKIESLENELQPILKNATDVNVPKAKAAESDYLEKLKSYKKFLDMKKGLDKHSPLPEPPDASVMSQEAMPSAQGEAPPISQTQISPQAMPTPEVSGDSGGLDPDTVNQLRQQMNPIEAQHADVSGENPGADLAEQLKPQVQDPMQAGSGESTDLLPEGSPVAPKMPTGLVDKQQLLSNFDTIVSDATSGLNQTPEDQALVSKLKDGMDAFKQQIVDAGNNPMALNEIKRRLYAQITSMSKTAYMPGNESVSPKIEMYQQIAGMLKNQIEHLVDVISPGMGARVKDINGEMGNFITAGKALSKAKPTDVGLDALLSPVKTMAKAAFGRPADIATAKAANALSKVNGVGDFVQSATPAIENKQVQKNIYNRHQDQYKDYSKKLLSNPSTKHLGAALDKAINSNNSLSQTQVLFVIQQSPQARKVIDGSNDSEIA